jgi:hypothetical protein
MFTDSLPINGRPYFARVRFPGMCLSSGCLAMDIHVTLFSYDTLK